MKIDDIYICNKNYKPYKIGDIAYNINGVPDKFKRLFVPALRNLERNYWWYPQFKYNNIPIWQFSWVNWGAQKLFDFYIDRDSNVYDFKDIVELTEEEKDSKILLFNVLPVIRDIDKKECEIKEWEDIFDFVITDENVDTSFKFYTYFKTPIYYICLLNVWYEHSPFQRITAKTSINGEEIETGLTWVDAVAITKEKYDQSIATHRFDL